jgi:hypothetical protein
MVHRIGPIGLAPSKSHGAAGSREMNELWVEFHQSAEASSGPWSLELGAPASRSPGTIVVMKRSRLDKALEG